MARVSPTKRENTEDPIVTIAREYAILKKDADRVKERQDQLKPLIFERVDTDGEVDEKGSVWFSFPEPVEGFVAFKKEKRSSRALNEEAAEKIIADKGLESKLYKTVRVIDEDAVMAALYMDELTEEEVAEMFTEKVTWALVMSKKK